MVIATGTCFALFAYEVAQAIDLDTAERLLLAGAERQTIKHKRRAPAYFEYRPAPLRVARDGTAHALGAYRSGSPVEELLGSLGAAAVRPRIADFVEDYSIFQIEAFAAPCEAAALWTEHAQTVAQVLRAEPRMLSQHEAGDATALRLSFGPNDATIIDTDATLLVDPEGDDVREVIEFANTQLLEMRFLDQQLDDALDRAYETLVRRPRRLGGLGAYGDRKSTR